MERQSFENGMTVRELKELAAGLPEQDANGEDCQVWMMTGDSQSSPVTEVWPLNQGDLFGATQGEIICEDAR